MIDEKFWLSKGYIKQSNGNWTHHSNLPDPRSTPKLEPNPGDAPLAKKKVQRPTGERFLIRVTSFRKRLIDEDNLCSKYLVDLCRYASILPSDAPDKCKIEIGQVKSKEEYVKIEIIR